LTTGNLPRKRRVVWKIGESGVADSAGTSGFRKAAWLIVKNRIRVPVVKGVAWDSV